MVQYFIDPDDEPSALRTGDVQKKVAVTMKRLNETIECMFSVYYVKCVDVSRWFVPFEFDE